MHPLLLISIVSDAVLLSRYWLINKIFIDLIRSGDEDGRVAETSLSTPLIASESEVSFSATNHATESHPDSPTNNLKDESSLRIAIQVLYGSSRIARKTDYAGRGLQSIVKFICQ